MSARQDAIDRAREQALRSTDPRAGQRKHRARLELYEQPISLAERGAELDSFIDPDDMIPVRRRGGAIRRPKGYYE